MGFLFRIPIFIVLMGVALYILFAATLILTYKTLSAEDPVATVVFDRTGDDGSCYIAHIEDKNRKSLGDFRLCADQWRMDAYFVKMKYLASILGMKSRYALDRFEGRYRNIDDERSHAHTVYQIEDHRMIDLPISPFWVDTEYGSSVFMDIDTDGKFRVLKTPTGLMIRKDKPAKAQKSIIDRAKDIVNSIM